MNLKAMDIGCVICNTVEDGYVISTVTKEDKVLICKNCIAKIKEVV